MSEVGQKQTEIEAKLDFQQVEARERSQSGCPFAEAGERQTTITERIDAQFSIIREEMKALSPKGRIDCGQGKRVVEEESVGKARENKEKSNTNYGGICVPNIRKVPMFERRGNWRC